MAKKYQLTEEGLKKIKGELEKLTGDRRKEIAEKLKEAISHGDLSENAAYSLAKEEQAFVEGKIIEIKEIIKNTEIIRPRGVILKINGKEKKYIIVGSNEANPKEGKISSESIVGKTILSKKPGEKFTIPTPSGEVEYEIIDFC
jgi:transcription elongation factor GreA